MQDNMCENKNHIIKYMPRKMTKNMRSKNSKRTKKMKMLGRTKKQTGLQKRVQAKRLTKGKSRKVILTKGRHSFKRTRTQKQKGGGLFSETDLMMQNLSEKISATQNTIQGAHIETSGKPWIQPELTKY